MNKKKWVVPELIVLVRSKPEEVVLGTCKGTLMTGTPDTDNINCLQAVVPGCTIECTTTAVS